MIEMVGKKCGFLTVLGRVGGCCRAGEQVLWVCRCVCGREAEARGRDLRKGKVKSCGCKKGEMCAAANRTHGASSKKDKWPEYRVWSEMLQRCYNPKNNRYQAYGARGVKVCTRWQESFEAFIKDMGRRPEKGLSLERRDNDGHYEPNNCYWATKKEQQRNKRTSKRITVDGVTRTEAEWAEITGVKRTTIASRLKAGMSPEEVVKPGRAHRREGVKLHG